MRGITRRLTALLLALSLLAGLLTVTAAAEERERTGTGYVMSNLMLPLLALSLLAGRLKVTAAAEERERERENGHRLRYE